MASMLDWIEAKRRGLEMDAESLASLVALYTHDDIPDYQMSAWLMAVTINGMTLDETCALTEAMVRSGETLDLSSLPGPTIDKHSSGGVGDKVTLALVPMLASSGAYIAKMSGHGLGLTGGTLDKLESVPGFRTNLSTPEILHQVEEIGACLCAQSDTLAPADRAIYALRDITGTVASIPLIASSIMSKKLACGADALLLDIKVGSGAFMRDPNSARELAETCLAIAVQNRKRFTAVLSNMDQPLGRAVGNGIELREAAAYLRPDAECADTRLGELTRTLYGEASRLLGWESITGGEGLLGSGKAAEKLTEILSAQGGDREAFFSRLAIDRLSSSVANAWQRGAVVAERSGVVQSIDAEQVARCASMLGASRERKGGVVDHDAGIWLAKTVGETVDTGETLAYLNSSDLGRINSDAMAAIQSAYIIADEAAPSSEIVIDILHAGGTDERPHWRNAGAA